MLGLHLFNMEEIGFVRYNHHRDSVSWMQLPDVLMEVIKQFITLIVSDGKDYHNRICPANTSVQLLITVQAVSMDLGGGGGGEKKQHCKKMMWLKGKAESNWLCNLFHILYDEMTSALHIIPKIFV